MASSPRIDELKKKFDENPRRYFAPLANEYRKSGDLEQAIQLCRAYLPQQPGHMSGHIVFGQALFESGEYDEARGVFETALSLDPENLIALRHLGDIARHGGDLPAARAWYQRVLDADPRNEEIASQIAALDAAAPPAPAAPAAPAGASGGWGDINPERSASEQPTVEAPAVPAVPIPRAADAPAVPQPAPRAAAAPSPAPQPPKAEFEREGEGDLAMPSPESAAARGGMEGVERSEEIAFDAGESQAKPGQGFGSANEYGFEVLEFVPPSREDTPRSVESVRPGHGLPFTGEVQAEETPAAFVTETMAELYLQQGFVQEALGVYRQLLAKNPKDAALRERVSSLEKGARSSVSVAAVSDAVVEHAQQRRQPKEGPQTVRDFFAALMRRRVLHRYEEPAAEMPSPEAALASATADLPMMDVYATTPRETAPEDRDSQETEAPDQDDAFIVPDGAIAPPGVSPEETSPAVRPAASEPAWLALATEAESAAAAPAAPEVASAPRPTTPRRGEAQEPTIDSLFPGVEVPPSDDQAAQALSGAFPTVEGAPIAGRPAERARDELSLDNVFREAERKTARASGAFSFDQFFSEGAAPAAPAPARTTDPSVASVGGPELSPDDDVAQFNDWLTGLKKK